MITRQTRPWCKLESEESSYEMKENQMSCGIAKLKNAKTAYKILFNKPEDKSVKEEFKILRDGQNSMDNMNPAVLLCFSSDLMINEDKLTQAQRRILQNGDVIHLPAADKTLTFIDKRAISMSSFPREITDQFFIGTTLGSGACGVVFVVHDKKTFEKFAIKSLSVEQAKNEIKLMNMFDHPHIIKLKKILYTDKVYLLLELMTCGDMVTYVSKQPELLLSEADTKFVAYQLLCGLEHMHSKGLAHLDVKLDNILVTKKKKEIVIKIGDLGSCRVDENIVNQARTRIYASPESSGDDPFSGKMSDIWSFGVCVYCFLCGRFPFDDESPNFEEKVREADFNFDAEDWDNISDEAKVFIGSLIVVDPVQRLSANGAMDQQWFNDEELRRRVQRLNEILSAEEDRPMENQGEISRKRHQSVRIVDKKARQTKKKLKEN